MREHRVQTLRQRDAVFGEAGAQHRVRNLKVGNVVGDIRNVRRVVRDIRRIVRDGRCIGVNQSLEVCTVTVDFPRQGDAVSGNPCAQQ